MLPVEFDRDTNVRQQIADLAPDFVIDASGPFQAYGDDPFRVVKAAIACGANYLDLADAAEFVCGIEAFDASARAAEVFVLSGASTGASTGPALTAAVCRRLAGGMPQVHSICGGIAPSPFSGVGPSVARAVAHSAGKPLTLIRDNVCATGHAFTDTRRYTIAPAGYLPLQRRVFSLVDLADLRLLKRVVPHAENIWMGAAPVPAVYHAALRVLARAVKVGCLPSIRRLAPLMSSVINRLAWGEHRGGMFIEICGRNDDGEELCRSWQMIAEGDDGPWIPSIASAAIIRNCLDGGSPAPGARPALEDLELEDFEGFLNQLNIRTGFREDFAHDDAPVFRKILGSAWQQLPNEIRELHDTRQPRRFAGRASVIRGRSVVARIIGRIAGIPPAASDIPLQVTMTPNESHGKERWTRDFGGHKFSSVMSAGKGRFSKLICENFGPVRIAMAAVFKDGRLHYVHRGWTFFGIPLPRILAPQGETCEYVENGRFHFHVEISLPMVGNIVTYDGWLITDG